LNAAVDLFPASLASALQPLPPDSQKVLVHALSLPAGAEGNAPLRRLATAASPLMPPLVQRALTSGANAGMAMLVTHMAAAIASLTWMGIEWIRLGKPTLVGTVTGTIAGLATITPASGYVGPLGALVIGVVSAFFCYSAVRMVKLRYVIDDALDVFAVHGIGGMTGSLLTAILMAGQLGGVGYDGGVTWAGQLFVQLTAVVVTVIWSAGITFTVVKITQALVGFRVVHEVETQGLDLTAHGEVSYNIAFGDTSE